MADRRIESIFSAALVRESQAERIAYLDGACGGDADLRARVETLLRAHDDASGFLCATREQRVEGELPGDVIGRYKLLQAIGEGGFGIVYMAEQLEPVRRKVALKVIKLGMDTRQVVARFESERQALALMDHLNIARVLDAGATALGRPYFVMELVRGIPITDYCDHNNLSARQRLELFMAVCQAVQHAHQKGIIHRDIKPTNVLVTLHDGRPVPKVIDFGIAKATNQRLTEKTLFTEFAWARKSSKRATSRPPNRSIENLGGIEGCFFVHRLVLQRRVVGKSFNRAGHRAQAWSGSASGGNSAHFAAARASRWGAVKRPCAVVLVKLGVVFLILIGACP